MYNEDYYERGVQTGMSLYENYHWIPELTVPMAMAMIDYLGIQRGDRVLDYGCAKGYLVKAMRWLSRDAWGYDTSNYAIANADAESKLFVSTHLWNIRFRYAIAKDVLEHINENDISFMLNAIPANVLFVTVPLGDGTKYNVPAYEMDVTHKIRQPLDWWVEMIRKAGWRVTSAKLRVEGIKDNWAMFKDGNGFITAAR